MSGRPCLSCKSPNRLAIDAAIKAGRPLETIADEYGTTVSRLRSHIRAGHVSRKAAPVLELEPGLLDLRELLATRLQAAVRVRDYRSTALLARETRKLLEDVRTVEAATARPKPVNPFKTKTGREQLAEIVAVFREKLPDRVPLLLELIRQHSGAPWPPK